MLSLCASPSHVLVQALSFYYPMAIFFYRSNYFPAIYSFPLPKSPLPAVMPPELGNLDALEEINLSHIKLEGKHSRSSLRSDLVYENASICSFFAYCPSCLQRSLCRRQSLPHPSYSQTPVAVPNVLLPKQTITAVCCA